MIGIYIRCWYLSMMNKIWIFLILFGFSISILTGNFDKMGDIIINSTDKALNVFINSFSSLVPFCSFSLKNLPFSVIANIYSVSVVKNILKMLQIKKRVL